MPFRLLGLVVDPSRAGELCGHSFAHYAAAGAHVTLACIAASHLSTADARKTLDRVGVQNALLLAVGRRDVTVANLEPLLTDVIAGLCPHVVVSDAADKELQQAALAAFQAARQRLRGLPERPAKLYFRALGTEPSHAITTALKPPGFTRPELFARVKSLLRIKALQEFSSAISSVAWLPIRRLAWKSAGPAKQRFPDSAIDRLPVNQLQLVGNQSRPKEEVMQFIVFLIIGGIAGALAGRVVSGHGYGIVLDIVVGVVGAFIGGWLLSTLLGVTGGGLIISFIAAFVGAVILLMLIRLVTGNRARV